MDKRIGKFGLMKCAMVLILFGVLIYGPAVRTTLATPSYEWTSVNDGSMDYSINLYPGNASCIGVPLPEGTFGSLVHNIWVSPQPDHISTAHSLLRMAANKVIVEGDWTPNDRNFIPKADTVCSHSPDYDGYNFFYYSTLIFTESDEKLLFGEHGLFVNKEGLGYYEARKKLYKEVISRAVYTIDKEQFQSWILRHSEFLDDVSAILSGVGLVQGTYEKILESAGKHLPWWGNIAKGLSCVMSIVNIIGSVDRAQEMMGIIALGTTIETKHKLDALYASVIADPIAGDYDKALFFAVKEVRDNFNNEWYGSGSEGEWKEFLEQAMRDAGGSDWKKDVALIAATAIISTKLGLAILPWKIGQELLDAKDAFRAGILCMTVYVFLQRHLENGTPFGGNNECERLVHILEANSLRCEFAYMSYACIMEYLTNWATNLGSWFHLGTLAEAKTFYAGRRDACKANADKRAYPWYIAGEQLTRDVGSADMRWLKDRLGLDPAYSISVTSPTSGSPLQIGPGCIISWTSSGDIGDYVKIEISRDGGSTWSEIVGSTYSGDGSHPWSVTGPTSNNCKIRVSSTQTPAVYGESGIFSIEEYCKDHNLAIANYSLSRDSIEPNDSVTASVTVQNRGVVTESGGTIKLLVQGPNYNDSASITCPTLSPGGISSDQHILWTPGSGGWNAATNNGTYSLAINVQSSAGCDADNSDNWASKSVYVSDNDDPPAYKAYKFKGYDFEEDELYPPIEEVTFKYIARNGPGTEFLLSVDDNEDWYGKGETYKSKNGEVIFWVEEMWSDGRIHMKIGKGCNNDSGFKDSEFGQTVIQGEEAVFTHSNPPTYYDERNAYYCFGDLENYRIIFENKADGEFSTSYGKVKVDTSGLAQGKYSFGVLSNVPDDSNYYYLAFGQYNVMIPKYTLTVDKNAAGNGSIKVNGTSHTLLYSGTFARNTSVTLEAVPGTGSLFASWSTGETSATKSLTITADTYLTANFSEAVQLALNKTSGQGSARIDDSNHTLPYSQSVAKGRTVKLEAVPGNGYRFMGWSGGGLAGDANPVSLSVSGNTSISTSFAKEWNISTSISGDGVVMVGNNLLAAAESAAVLDGEKRTISTVPGYGYELKQLSIKAVAADGSVMEVASGADEKTMGALILTIKSNLLITAQFALMRKSLNISAEPSGALGAIVVDPAPEADGKYPFGKFVLLKSDSSCSSGYAFNNWIGDATGTTSWAWVTMLKDRTVKAVLTDLSQASTIHVVPEGSSGGKSPCCTCIQNVVNRAKSGATINLAQGTYNENVTISSKTLNLLGGWDSAFTTNSQNKPSLVNGNVSIKSGKYNIKGVRFKPVPTTYTNGIGGGGPWRLDSLGVE